MRSSDILIVDDEIGIRAILSDILEDEGYTVTVAENADAARQLRLQAEPALVLLDIWMSDCDGITLLKEWATQGLLSMPVVMMSGHASVDTANDALKIGAVDFLEKPITRPKLLSTVEKALKNAPAKGGAEGSVEFLGNSPMIQELIAQLERVKQTNSCVLLTGEYGSPFDSIAKRLHRPGEPWVELSKISRVSDTPIELLNKASGGVLYLGDISRYSKSIQQDIAFMMNKASRMGARIVCACVHSEEEAEMCIPFPALMVAIPSLRRHKEDIPAFVHDIQNEEPHRVRFSSDAIDTLMSYHWPGNREQLRSVVRSLMMTGQSTITSHEVNAALGLTSPDTIDDTVGGFDFNQPLRELRQQVEKRYFEYHIARENQNISRAAQKVGLERTHLYRKLSQLGIRLHRSKDDDKD